MASYPTRTEQAASTSATGTVELATAAEVTTGTDTTRALTADALTNSAPTFDGSNLTGIAGGGFTMVGEVDFTDASEETDHVASPPTTLGVSGLTLDSWEAGGMNFNSNEVKDGIGWEVDIAAGGATGSTDYRWTWAALYAKYGTRDPRPGDEWIVEVQLEASLTFAANGQNIALGLLPVAGTGNLAVIAERHSGVTKFHLSAFADAAADRRVAATVRATALHLRSVDQAQVLYSTAALPATEPIALAANNQWAVRMIEDATAATHYIYPEDPADGTWLPGDANQLMRLYVHHGATGANVYVVEGIRFWFKG